MTTYTHPYVRLFPKLVAPTVSDDDTAGYENGDLWLDTVASKSYQAFDVTTGAAIWVELTGGGGTTQEQVEDWVGAMVSGNTETGIAVTYDDPSGKLNFDAQTAGDARYAPLAKGVTNGDTHDHNGGDGGTIDHVNLNSIGTNTHAQIDTFIGTTAPATYAPIAKGVTNGDTHDHNGGDGAQIDHTTLSNIGTNSHATIDSTLAALASTYAPIAKGVTNGDTHNHAGGDGGTIDLADLTNRTATIGNDIHLAGAITLDDADKFGVEDESAGAPLLSLTALNLAGYITAKLNSASYLLPSPGLLNGFLIDQSGWAEHSLSDTNAILWSQGGWINRTETWTRTGNHTFTVTGDMTAIYRKGAKVRYKDGGAYEYGTIYSAVYTSLTTITLFTNTDYAMAATTITDTWISYIDIPDGFPASFAYTPTTTGITVGNGTMVCNFTTMGTIVTGFWSFTLGTTSSVAASPTEVTFTFPCTLVSHTSLNGWLTDTGVNAYMAYCDATTTAFYLRVINVSGTYAVYTSLGSLIPFTWGNTDKMVGVYVARF